MITFVARREAPPEREFRIYRDHAGTFDGLAKAGGMLGREVAVRGRPPRSRCAAEATSPFFSAPVTR